MSAAFFSNWTGQARKGILELVFLNDIAARRMYGYEIEKRYCKVAGLIVSEGMLYRILRRFRKHGLVEVTQTRSPDGPNRKYYQLTGAGKVTLAQMNASWQSLKRQADYARRSK